MNFRLILATLLATAGVTITAQAQPAGVTLDDKTTQSFLTNMGYEVQKVDDGAYSISTKAGAYTVTITAELSSNHQNLWLSAVLRFLPDSGPLPADLLEGILKESNDDFPRFYIASCDTCQTGQKRRLKIGVAILNQAVTPVLVRKMVDSLDTVILATAKVWDSSAWPPATGATAPANTSSPSNAPAPPNRGK
jgi:hypothetical protein